jgi:hypothetical protein
MAFHYINTGSGANKGDGDSLRVAFWKINQNFANVRTTSTVTILGDNNAPLIDIKAFSGSFDLPADSSSIQLFEFDQQVYRSASVDVFASDNETMSQDAGTSYLVTWNSATSHIVGTGIVSLFQDGSTGNATWDLNTSISNNRVRVQAQNVSGSTASNTISWQAKVSLFRL